eukprot:gene1025-biopygen11600
MLGGAVVLGSVNGTSTLAEQPTTPQPSPNATPLTKVASSGEVAPDSAGAWVQDPTRAPPQEAGMDAAESFEQDRRDRPVQAAVVIEPGGWVNLRGPLRGQQ